MLPRLPAARFLSLHKYYIALNLSCFVLFSENSRDFGHEVEFKPTHFTWTCVIIDVEASCSREFIGLKCHLNHGPRGFATIMRSSSLNNATLTGDWVHKSSSCTKHPSREAPSSACSKTLKVNVKRARGQSRSIQSSWLWILCSRLGFHVSRFFEHRASRLPFPDQACDLCRHNLVMSCVTAQTEPFHPQPLR